MASSPADLGFWGVGTADGMRVVCTAATHTKYTRLMVTLPEHIHENPRVPAVPLLYDAFGQLTVLLPAALLPWLSPQWVNVCDGRDPYLPGADGMAVAGVVVVLDVRAMPAFSVAPAEVGWKGLGRRFFEWPFGAAVRTVSHTAPGSGAMPGDLRFSWDRALSPGEMDAVMLGGLMAGRWRTWIESLNWPEPATMATSATRTSSGSGQLAEQQVWPPPERLAPLGMLDVALAAIGYGPARTNSRSIARPSQARQRVQLVDAETQTDAQEAPGTAQTSGSGTPLLADFTTDAYQLGRSWPSRSHRPGGN